MWLDRMFKDRQEILVLGELLLFLAAWGLGLAAAVNDHRERTNAGAENNVAANSDYTNSDYTDGDFSGPDYSEQLGSEQMGF